MKLKPGKQTGNSITKMNFLLKIITRQLSGCLIILISSCNLSSQPALPAIHLTTADSMQNEQRLAKADFRIGEVKPLIKTGDVVTRTGNDFTSESLRKLCRRNTTYSHCGIASIENDSLFIYHTLGGEWNPDEKLKRESFEQFADPYTNNGLGLFRFDMSQIEVTQLIKVVHRLFSEHLKFDMKFDLSTDDRMYCAEFLYKSFKEASKQQIMFAKSRIGDFEFIGVDDIFLYPGCNKIIEIVYK